MKPTFREKQIIKGLSDGLTTKQIAEQLSISIHTVESHKRNLMLKLRAKNTAHLTVLAERLGWNVSLAIFFFCIFSINALVCQNLIVNPSAELDPTTNGWTPIDGNWTTRCENPVAFDGQCYFYAGAAPAVAELYQEVDVSANATDIDLGTAQYIFSVRMRSWTQTPADESQVILEFQDNGAAVLDTYDTGLYNNVNFWVQVLDTLVPPIGTRTIKVRLISHKTGGFTNSDGYFDHLYLSDNPILPDEYTHFPIAEQALLDHHLDIINDATSWQQTSVDTTGILFQRYVNLDPSYWEAYFQNYFATRYFSFNLYFYIQHRVFWWNGDDQHLNLQRGMAAGLKTLENRMFDSTPNDPSLADSLTNNTVFRDTWRNIHEYYHRYFPNEGLFFIDPVARDSVVAQALKLIDRLPHFLEKPVEIDHTLYPHIHSVRVQLYANLAAAAFLDPTIKASITDRLNIASLVSPLEIQLWNDHGILDLNNAQTDSATLQVFNNNAIKIPSNLHEWTFTKLQSELNASEGRTYVSSYHGQLSYWPSNVPTTATHYFPEQSNRPPTESFTIGTIWDVASNIYNVTIQENVQSLGDYKDSLITRAGSSINNYAFNSSARTDNFYIDNPIWFFNDHFRMYYANSQEFLNLALERWDQGRPHALSQFMLYTNLFAINSDSTRFYHIGRSR